LSGDVAIAVPLAWQSIGYLIFGGVAAAGLFLLLASYSRVETVTGVIIPDKGVAEIIPSRAGVIAALAVRDGQIVTNGSELATIRAEEDGDELILSAKAIREGFRTIGFGECSGIVEAAQA